MSAATESKETAKDSIAVAANDVREARNASVSHDRNLDRVYRLTIAADVLINNIGTLEYRRRIAAAADDLLGL